MNTSPQKFPLLAAVLLAFAVAEAPQGFAQGTAFTYQGRLASGTNVANGIFDLRFAIYDAPADGNAIGSALTNSSVSVTNGLFTVSLDFGAGIFTGANRWLEINVRTNGAQFFSILTPRQPILSTPYAISAGFINATNITGIVPQNRLGSGTYNVDTFLRGDGTWGALVATETNSISKLNGFGTNTTLIGANTIGLKATATASNGVALKIPQFHKIVIDGTNNGSNPDYDFGKIIIGAHRDGTNGAGASMAVPDQFTIYAAPFPNNGGYIRFWGTHGGPKGLVMIAGGDVDLLPGTGGGLQIGDSGGSIGSQIYMQYRNGTFVPDPLGQSHALEFRAKYNPGDSNYTYSARAAIQGWATITNQGNELGELRFYARVPEWANANNSSTPNTAGVEIFRANTNGIVASSGRKFVGDGSGLTNVTVTAGVSSGILPLSYIQVREEFLLGGADQYGAATSGTLGQNGWVFTAASVVLRNDTAWPNVGCWDVTTSGVSGSTATISGPMFYGAGTLVGLHSRSGWTNTFIFRLNSTANVLARVGMLSPGAPADSANVPGFFVYYSSATNANFFVASGSTTPGLTYIDSGVTADTSFHKFTAWCESAGTVKMRVDNSTVISVASVPSLEVSPCFSVSTLTGSAKSITVDFFDFTAAVSR